MEWLKKSFIDLCPGVCKLLTTSPIFLFHHSCNVRNYSVYAKVNDIFEVLNKPENSLAGTCMMSRLTCVKFRCFAMKQEVVFPSLYMDKSATNSACLIRVPAWWHLRTCQYSLHFDPTPVKSHDCILHSRWQNLCTDRQTDTWQSPLNCFCGCSRYNGCLQEHCQDDTHTDGENNTG